MKTSRPPFEKYYSFVFVILVAYFISDLIILSIRDKTLPQQPPPPKPPSFAAPQMTSRGAFNSVISRNIFSSEGVIPNPLTSGDNPQDPTKEEVPVPSSLPITLVGTIVLSSHPEKSLASIEVKSKNQILAYSPGQEIEGLANVTQVERRKVIFRNLNNNRLEFIEIKSTSGISFSKSKATVGAGEEIKQESDNQFSINRSDLLKYTNDLSSILMQARAVPHRNIQTGEVDGFTLMDIQEGSVFEKLGLKRLDIIKSVNGEPVDSPSKAMELYQALKNSPSIGLGVERNGKIENITYTIK